MKAVVFCGPSIDHAQASTLFPEARFHGPARCGDVYRCLAQQPAAIGIIDGYFDQTLPVWHKEILWALAQGVRVYGASSMGALRAAELASFGMIGVGVIFAQYASGALEDDDEVAVSHEPEEFGFRVRSEAMVNVRATLLQAVRDTVVSAATANQLLGLAKNQFYADRSYPALFRSAAAVVDPSELMRLQSWLEQRGPVNQKRDDAAALLSRMRRDLSCPAPSACRFIFSHTNAWQVLVESLQAEDRVIGAAPAGDVAEPSAKATGEGLMAGCDPASRHRLWKLALERALALQLPESEADIPDEHTLQRASENFPLERGLLTQEQTDAWLRDNDLDLPGFSRLVYEDMLARRAHESAQSLAAQQIPDVLRIQGLYSDAKTGQPSSGWPAHGKAPTRG